MAHLQHDLTSRQCQNLTSIYYWLHLQISLSPNLKYPNQLFPLQLKSTSVIKLRNECSSLLLLLVRASKTVRAVNKISAFLNSGLLGLGLGVGHRLKSGDVSLAPVDDQGLSNQEKHGADLGDTEETPDGCLLLQVGGDHGGHDGAEEE